MLRTAAAGFLVAIIALTVLIELRAYENALRETPQVRVVAEGLRNPVGMALLPDGGLLIAEEGTGERDLSAGVSLMLPDGTVGRYVSELPSGRDSGDLSGVALVQVSPDFRTLYIGNFGAGHLWTLPLPQGALSLPPTPYTPAELGTTMLPFNRVLLTNPFDMTFDAAGVPVVADASQNGVAKETADGRTQFIHRFAELVDPTNENLTIDPVPTGIDRIGDEYYVTLTGGCPYPPGGGELVAIDENRNQRTVVDDLNMPIDVAQGPDGRIWLLEFARFAPDGSCFSGSGYLADTPGIRSLNVWDVEPDELDGYFLDIAAHVNDCKFRNCTHTNEPGCAVRAAVEAGAICQSRYSSYLLLRDELKETYIVY